jgi:hypothetical protein
MTYGLAVGLALGLIPGRGKFNLEESNYILIVKSPSLIVAWLPNILIEIG